MNRIYLDHAASTPLRPEAAGEMARVWRIAPGNPSSTHAEGRAARRVLEDARDGVAASLGLPSSWILFTRGGTESDNFAIFGRAGAEPRGSVVVSTIEHSAVREAAFHLREYGRKVRLLPVRPDGTADPSTIEAALTVDPPPAVVSVQAVNSETGLVVDVDPIIDQARSAGVPVHVDAVQAAGRVPLPGSAGRPVPDLLTLSGHKIGGPRGIGILARDPAVALRPLLHGGGQERGIRPGTEDVASAVGFDIALRHALAEEGAEAPRLRGLRDDLERALSDRFPGILVHGSGGERAPHILNVGLSGVPGDLLLAALDVEGIAASAGSACRSGSIEPSPVLLSLHGEMARDVAPIRFSLGRDTDRAAIDAALPRIVGVFERIMMDARP